MTPRLTKPEKGNPYYNTPDAGGYAVGIIKGKPTDAGCNVLCNCVGYAAGRYNEIIGKGRFLYWAYAPDADKWITAAKQQGLQTGSQPRVGAVIVWGGGGKHVEIVEKVNADGSIITSGSGWNSFDFRVTHRYPANNWGGGTNYTFLGFVYQPETTPLIKRGDTGDNVREMQTALYKLGYLRKNEIDGDFGTITFGALLAMQFDSKLTVDGICGNETRAKLGI